MLQPGGMENTLGSQFVVTIASITCLWIDNGGHTDGRFDEENHGCVPVVVVGS
jgi:hypothetical protein